MTRYYDLPVDEQTISIESLRAKDSEFQIDIMRIWFYQNYQDPVHECPYDGREGGYAYIHGGPFEAEAGLYSEFGGIVDEEVIAGLAEELDMECSDWSGMPKQEDYDDYLFEVIGSSVDPIGSLKSSLDTLRNMLSLELGESHEATLLQMIYVNLITVLEAFLSEFFIGKMEESNLNLRSFVESNPDFQKEKFSLSDIFKKYENLDSHVKEYLIDLLWHNLPKLKPMFRSSLGIRFPESIEFLINATHTRHDLVHRGGKTKDGEPVELDKNGVEELISEIHSFAEHIEKSQFPEL